MHLRGSWTVLLSAVLAGPPRRQPAARNARPSAPLMVFAASDLGPPFAQIVPQFERQTRTDVTLVLGSTGMLAQQIRNGAPADVFFAANESFIADLAAENLTLRADARPVCARPHRDGHAEVGRHPHQRPRRI